MESESPTQVKRRPFMRWGSSCVGGQVLQSHTTGAHGPPLAWGVSQGPRARREAMRLGDP